MKHEQAQIRELIDRQINIVDILQEGIVCQINSGTWKVSEMNGAVESLCNATRGLNDLAGTYDILDAYAAREDVEKAMQEGGAYDQKLPKSTFRGGTCGLCEHLGEVRWNWGQCQKLKMNVPLEEWCDHWKEAPDIDPNTFCAKEPDAKPLGD